MQGHARFATPIYEVADSLAYSLPPKATLWSASRREGQVGWHGAVNNVDPLGLPAVTGPRLVNFGMVTSGR